jgi:hypothetical protein
MFSPGHITRLKNIKGEIIYVYMPGPSLIIWLLGALDPSSSERVIKKVNHVGDCWIITGFVSSRPVAVFYFIFLKPIIYLHFPPSPLWWRRRLKQLEKIFQKQ